MDPKNQGQEKPALISRQGYERLHWRLQYLLRVSRLEVAGELKEAASHGYGEANLELKAAREKHRQLEWSIARLMEEMALCRVVVTPPPADGRVHFGSLVRLLNLDRDREEVYQIVGRFESDPAQGRISLDSPLGSALEETEAGAMIKVETPKGKVGYLVLEVE